MYPFTDFRTTNKYHSGTNACKYIIIHHTAGGTYASNLNRLSGNKTGLETDVSVQFII